MIRLGAIIKRGSKLSKRIKVRRLSANKLQEKTLKRLLKKARETSFGQYYDFNGLLCLSSPIDAFQKNIPIHDYQMMHDRWWNLCHRNVENVCWKGQVKYFALSSGTAESTSKHIPITDDMIKAIQRAGIKMFYSLLNFDVNLNICTKDMMMLGGSSDLTYKGNYFVGDLSGINASKIPFWLRRTYKPGKEISKISDWNTRLDEIAKNAVNWDVGFIMGIPSWLQLMLEKIMDYHNLDHIHQIWPNLKVYVHGGVAFEPYEKGFEKLLKEPMIYMDTYLASEGFFAFQNRPNTKAMAMLLDNGIFYEFIPFNKNNFNKDGNLKSNPEVLLIDEVEENIDYALVISTCAGAWRYLIGDTIRFINKEKNEIIITGRTKHFLSTCGEHLSVDNMNRSIQKMEDDFEIDICEYTVASVSIENSFAHKWYIGCDQKIDTLKFSKRLDEHLKKLNDDYATERNAVLHAPQIEIIPTALFYQWMESKAKMGGQNKFPRVMNAKLFSEWEDFIKIKKYC